MKKGEKGQSVVEFALIVPIFIMLLCGLLDFGRVFHAYLTIDHACREAARAASIGEDYETVRSIAVNRGSSIDLTADDISIDPPGIIPPSGMNVTITITYPVTLITPGVSSLTGTINLTNSTVMRVE